MRRKTAQEELMVNLARFTQHQLEELMVFEGLEERVQVALAQASRMLRLEAKAEILSHLHESRDVYFIVSGTVRVNMVAAGGRQITYQLLPPGEMFGELAAIDGLPRSASVLAEEACVLGRIDVGTFNQLIRDHPSLALTVMRRLARLSRVLTSRVFEYHTYDVRGRIYTELIRLTESAALESPQPILLTARDMASRVGTTRENVARIYSELRKNGVIEKTGVRVMDPKALSTMLTACEFG
ncbi:MAG: CRP/FNR family cyclic AMP-dependent transcriptional regulator [Gammaproteobacteria bacterium]